MIGSILPKWKERSNTYLRFPDWRDRTARVHLSVAVPQHANKNPFRHHDGTNSFPTPAREPIPLHLVVELLHAHNGQPTECFRSIPTEEGRSLIISSISLERLPRSKVPLHRIAQSHPTRSAQSDSSPGTNKHSSRDSHTACTPSYAGNLRHASAQSISPSTSSVTTLITSSICPMSCIIVSRSLKFLNNYRQNFTFKTRQMNRPIRPQATHRSVMVLFCKAAHE